jgi:membrane protease YdiL (CAAX protease family)
MAAGEKALAEAANNASPISTFAIFVGLVVNALIYVPLIALGMLASARVHLLGAPLLASLVKGDTDTLKGRARSSLVAGIKVGVIVGIGVAILTAVSQPWIKAYFVKQTGRPWPSVGNPSPWQSLLGAVYAGIAEEIVFRFFLLSVVAWLVSRLWRIRHGTLPAGAFWISNVISALIFGMVHLSGAAQLGLALPPVVVQVLLLNGIAGAGLGWLYWKYGLESAMMGHFVIGIVAHVVAPVLLPV